MASASFFLGANAPGGFVSLFEKVYGPDWNVTILKGGPGTGKSSLMKKLAKSGEKRGLDVYRILCSSDPDSLDGVIFPALKTCIFDGTAPQERVSKPKQTASPAFDIRSCFLYNLLREMIV